MLLTLALVAAAGPPTLEAVRLDLPARPVQPGVVQVEGRVVVRTEAGWTGADGTSPDEQQAARLGWWDQATPEQTVLFGHSFVVLWDGREARVVRRDGEQRLPATGLAVRGDDLIRSWDRADGPWTASHPHGGDVAWELAGAGDPQRLGNDLTLALPGGLRVLVDPADGSPRQVLEAGRSGGAFGDCRLVLPEVPGALLRCVGTGAEWSVDLLGDTVSTLPVRVDLDGQGAEELVVLTDGGSLLALDRRGQLLARRDLGSWSDEVVALAAEERSVVVVWGGSVQRVRLRTGEGPTGRPPAATSWPVDAPAEACATWLDRLACLGLAEERRAGGDRLGTGLALAFACELGELGACEELAADPQVAQDTDGSFWERGCRLGSADLCAGLVEHVDPARRAGARQLACARGLSAFCASEPVVTPVASEEVPTVVSGRVLQDGEPVPGVRVVGREPTRTDRKGRFRVEAGEQIWIEPAGGGRIPRSVGEGDLEVELPVLERTEVRVAALDGRVPAVLTVDGCARGPVAVDADEGGAFVEVWAEAGRTCELAGRGQSPVGPGARWEGTVQAGQSGSVGPVLPERTRVVDPDGRPLRWAVLPGLRTDGDGRVLQLDDGTTCPGLRRFEGYEEICHVLQWPLELQGGPGFLLRRGDEVRRVSSGQTWVEAGTWSVDLLDGRRTASRTLRVDGPRSLELSPKQPAPSLVVLGPDGRALAGRVVHTVAGDLRTDAGGHLRSAAVLGPWTVDGPAGPVSGRGPGRVRLDSGDRSRLAWRVSPAGLVVEHADPAWVDLHPGDLLLEVAGRGARTATVGDLEALCRPSGCPLVVSRAGRRMELDLRP